MQWLVRRHEPDQRESAAVLMLGLRNRAPESPGRAPSPVCPPLRARSAALARLSAAMAFSRPRALPSAGLSR